MVTLSSSYTFFYKFVFIFIWLIGFGAGTREILFIDPQFDGKWVQYATSWIGLALVIYFVTGSIKQVQLDRAGKLLLVSNFLKSAEIDLREIEDVGGSSFLSPKLVWFSFRKKTVFGKKVIFMPAHRASPGIGVHPLVTEMRKELQLD